MMKLINRILIIAVIAFGAWFIIQHWDSVEVPQESEDGGEIVFEVEKGGEELVIDIDSDLSFEEQLEALKSKTGIKPVTTLKSTKKTYSSPTSVSTEGKTEIIPQEESVVTVYLFDGGIDLSVSVIPAGHVTFMVRNDGRVSHDFAVEGIEDFGRIVPGSMHTFEIDLSKGEYVLLSPREIDQQLDMRETLRVESSK